MLKQLRSLILKAKDSEFYMFILNRMLWVGIPFNKPHKLKVERITDTFVTTVSPYIRRNFNHIKGIHACCIATVAEFSSGLLLISKLDPGKYRLIMADLHAEYHYQAKSKLTAKTELSEDVLEEEVIAPLNETDKIIKKMQTFIYDADNNHVATVTTQWQIKSWAKVKTKV